MGDDRNRGVPAGGPARERPIITGSDAREPIRRQSRKAKRLNRRLGLPYISNHKGCNTLAELWCVPTPRSGRIQAIAPSIGPNCAYESRSTVLLSLKPGLFDMSRRGTRRFAGEQPPIRLRSGQARLHYRNCNLRGQPRGLQYRNCVSLRKGELHGGCGSIDRGTACGHAAKTS
jgi:hypothetical protein